MQGLLREMSWLASAGAWWLLLGAAAWGAWVWACHWLLAPGFRGGDVAACTTCRAMQVYARVVHRLRVEGLEHVPRDRSPEGRGACGLIVACNHTSGVDPVLVQAVLSFEARWVMALDMRAASLEWFWEFARIIFVDRERGDAAGLRECVRHLRAGLTLGLFPEGGIERPPRQLLAFQPGVGLMAQRGRAAVLPVLIEGTPQVDPAWAALTRRSRARVRVLPMIEAASVGGDAEEFSARLRALFEKELGWEE
jgi:1-acyl-sn-glycerol-3-phosphate acyltransferase